MFRCISSMNCHNILEYIVASSLCSAAAASSLCICSLCSSSLCIIKLPAADHQTIKLHCFCISSNCAAVHEIIKIYVCSKASRYQIACKSAADHRNADSTPAADQKDRKTNCSSSSNCLQLIIKQSSCIAAACHPTVCSCA